MPPVGTNNVTSFGTSVTMTSCLQLGTGEDVFLFDTTCQYQCLPGRPCQPGCTLAFLRLLFRWSSQGCSTLGNTCASWPSQWFVSTSAFRLHRCLPACSCQFRCQGDRVLSSACVYASQPVNVSRFDPVCTVTCQYFLVSLSACACVALSLIVRQPPR